MYIYVQVIKEKKITALEMYKDVGMGMPKNHENKVAKVEHLQTYMHSYILLTCMHISVISV